MPTLTQLAEVWRKERAMRIISADALYDAMYHEAFENDASYNEKNPMAKWESGLWIRYKMFENCLDNAPTIETKQIKYFDEDEKVWKIGNVIMEQKNELQAEIPEYAEWKEPFEKMTDCPWK